MTSEDEPAPSAEREVWCRLETAGPGSMATVRRVSIMQANGEIVASWPPDHFEPGLVERMRSGHIRAVLVVDTAGDGKSARVSLRDLTGREVFSAAV